VLPFLLKKYDLKDIFNADECGMFSAFSHTNHMLLNMNYVMEAGGRKIELLCLCVQIWMDLKGCHCW
jgi:hypothetical protein